MVRLALMAGLLIGGASCSVVAGLGSEKQLAPAAVTNDAGAAPDAAPDAPFVQGDGEIIAHNQDRPHGIGVDKTFVVWTNQGSGTNGAVVRFVKSSAETSVLASSQATPEQLLVDDGAAYWNAIDNPVEADGGVPVKVLQLGRVTLADGTVTLIDDDNAFSKQRRMALTPTKAANDTFLFVAYNDRVRRFIRTSTASKDVLASAPAATQPLTAITTDSQYVYWFGGNQVFRRAKLLDTAQDTLASVNGPVNDMTVDGTTLWLALATGDVSQVPTTALGGTALKVASVAAGLHTIVVDAGTAYVLRGTAGSTDGQVIAITPAGTRVLADRLPDPHELAIDRSVAPAMLYWTNSDGTIRRTPAAAP